MIGNLCVLCWCCYRPQTYFAKVMFLHLSVILSTGGGGMHGCSGGAWLLPGGHVWLLLGGACVVALGRGHAWLLLGCVCVVALGGHAWLLPGGGVHGIPRDTEIWSMSGRYASYWNAFLYYFQCYEEYCKKIQSPAGCSNTMRPQQNKICQY